MEKDKQAQVCELHICTAIVVALQGPENGPFFRSVVTFSDFRAASMVDYALSVESAWWV
ncbi:hypothetical protein BN11_4510020 [Nostocoides australiense Ben110]|uniref:Uncharacterized protein n=1 Tax=Nostocoides australiense Ben110 TaxID=1193182 RepID=W6K474_9MICO|nr:hypothetical protein [Tetrasphaera australiensis]CCH74519.1 hypothetical protein BN11_4510020 [Tetrasphaera australiensis Ben110]